MAKETLIEKQWVDIIAPPAPESDALVWWLLVIILGIFICAIIYWWQKQPSQTARRKINTLSKQNRSGKYDSKVLLKQLEKILCQRYGVSHLSRSTFYSKQWAVYRVKLEDACYQAQTPDRQQTQKLIRQSKYFIYSFLKT